MTIQELDALVSLLASRPKLENPTPELLRERFGRLVDILPAPGDMVSEPVDAGGVPG